MARVKAGIFDNICVERKARVKIVTVSALRSLAFITDASLSALRVSFAF